MSNKILKAVDGDFRFVEGSLREQIYKAIRRSKDHAKPIDAIREEFGDYLGYANALRVLRSRKQVTFVKPPEPNHITLRQRRMRFEKNAPGIVKLSKAQIAALPSVKQVIASHRKTA